MESCRQYFVIAISMTVVMGCGDISEPLSDEQSSVVDVRLLGEWKEVRAVPKRAAKGRKEPEPFSVTFTPREGSKMLTVGTPGDPSGGDQLWTMRLGERDFASAAEGNHKREWYILQYRFLSQDEMEVFMLDSDRAVLAIKKGDLQGTLGKSIWGREFLKSIKPDRKTLQKYLADHPDDLFDLKDPVLRLKRVVKASEPTGT